MTDTIETRVARGVALMDERLPGWHERIDLEELEMTSGCCCILGQEFDGKTSSQNPIGYDIAVAELFGGYELEAADYGFTVYDGDDEWIHLEAEWERIIRARREEASC